MALNALKSKFDQILVAEGLSINDLKSAHLLFTFPPHYQFDQSCDCHSCLVSNKGKVYCKSVDHFGRSFSPNPSFNPDVASVGHFPCDHS